MKSITVIKKSALVFVVLAVVFGALNMGAYNPHNELAVLLPVTALATDLEAPILPVIPALTSQSDSTSQQSQTSQSVVSSITSCEVTASAPQVAAGTNVVISWTTQGFSQITLNGQTVSSPNGSQTFTNVQENTTYTLIAKTADGKSECVTTVTVYCIPVPSPTCTLTPVTLTISSGETVTLNWTTTNAKSASLTDFGTVPTAGSRTTGPLNQNKTYTLTVIGNDNSTITCLSNITVTSTPVPPPTCTLTPATLTINSGETVTLNWTSTNAASANLTGFGTVPTAGTRTTGPLTQNQTYTLTVTNSNNVSVTCISNITVTSPLPTPTCTLNPAAVTIDAGQVVTLQWTTTNAASATLTDFGSVPVNGTRTTGALTVSKTYTLTVLGTNGSTITCHSVITIRQTPPPVPVCNLFSANPSTITRGATSTLTWSTTNATRVVIDNGIGEVNATGTISVSPLSTSEYTMTVYGVNNQQVSCKTKVTVNVPPLAPDCVAFTATPTSLPVGGGAVKLAWTTTNATAASISPLVGAVALNGSTTVSIASSTTFTLTASGANSQSDSCAVTVLVTPPTPVPITCANNVTFNANPNSIKKGNSSTLSWSTTGVTGVSFNQGITATGLSGSVSVSPTSDTTYVLTATTATTTIACPVSINVESGGGGGGGSSTPTCELSVSRNKINRGDEVTLRWESSRATDLEIKDSANKVIVTTNGLLSKDKSRLFDGSVRVAPTRDTTYTLTVERGSRDRECKVKVEVNNPVVVSQIRDQQPLIAGIALSQVPYTGFAAGPILTISFYLLLLAWALYVAYLLVVRRNLVGAGYHFAEPDMIAPVLRPEEIRPDVFVASVQTPVAPPSVQYPADLPVGNPVVGYASVAGVATSSPVVSTNPHHATDEVVTAIENHAHAKKALLSSDAIRHFIGTTSDGEERIVALNEVIALAKEKYPSEDGWVVINEKRMQNLCQVCAVNALQSNVAPYVPATIPEGSGSLAEAIVTGNIVAAYELIGHRPMFALADAAADLDSLYRSRLGGQEVLSTYLKEATATLSNEQIRQMIDALTSALDGVYTDEAAAVKMAIMKAVKVVA